MPEIEPINEPPDAFASDPDTIILWQKTGAIIDLAMKHMARGMVFSVMLSRLTREVRWAYGEHTAKRLLQGFVDTTEDLKP